MEKELNARQWALYSLLRNNPDKRFKQYEIYKRLYHYYGDSTEDVSSPESFHDCAARLLITSDIRKINDSSIIQKIIISNAEGVKLASKEEFEKYINGQFAAIFRKLERTRKKARKGGLDGQMRFTYGGERDTVEAFTDDINRLKAARLNKGLKLADVVRELKTTEKGIDISLLSKMENGYCKPTERLLLKLSELYECEALTLIDETVICFDGIA